MSEDEFRTSILALKHKSTEQVWNGGASATDGDWASSSDVDFYIEGDMVHVADQKPVKKYADWFIKHINKFDEIITDLQKSRNLTAEAN